MDPMEQPSREGTSQRLWRSQPQSREPEAPKDAMSMHRSQKPYADAESTTETPGALVSTKVCKPGSQEGPSVTRDASGTVKTPEALTEATKHSEKP